ncbi:deSI-like protein At4g17486 [Punica granatum]|uniref:DeSI-like protein At4g17486 n=2 Tax=Punica granatum TaxID=22663 RepID=A0A6P8D0Z4_PUNGR|nr:deSI-like protein At4g17486 [Punica granatum]XP_031390041.1 deSI-like protein At4g17486 [Punica granatum]PKI47544.1 hypothetical protein CRG98_032134 [Punica granatum]
MGPTQRNFWKSVISRRNRTKPANHFRSFQRVNSISFNQTPVFLNVYDLTPANGYFYWAGLGIFHSGVEIYGVEYAFGAHDYPTTGVFETEPQKCPGFKFRRSILVGTTSLGPLEIREFIERLSKSYNGDTYNLIIKNCNHFCEDICYKLTGNRIPKWVNRLARIGSVCHGILPRSVKVAAVGVRDSNFQEHNARKKRTRTTAFGCLSSMSLHRKKVMMSSLFLPSHYKICIPPQEMKRSKSKSRWLLGDIV